MMTLPVAYAGFPSPAGDYLEQNLDLNRLLIQRPAATFFMRAVGDAIHDAGIRPGDILIEDRSLDPLPNRIAVTIVEGELRVQRLPKHFKGEVWGIVTAGIRFIH
jgi:DNA polymerase V